MKLFTAGLATETNTFAPMPTGADDYHVIRGGPTDADQGITALPMNRWRHHAARKDWALVQSLCASAGPAGLTTRATYEGFRDEILADLKAAMPVDVVLLTLHGAMAADGYEDCEGDLIERVRAMVGPNVVVGAELDPHCSLTPKMLENATVLTCYKEFPHTDVVPVADDLFRLAADAAEGKTKPVMSTYDCRLISSFFTTIEPMKGFVAKTRAAEGQGPVLSVSTAHGFPFGDVPEIGTRMLVITNNDPQAGARLAEDLGTELVGLRGTTHPRFLSTQEALEQGQQIDGGPVVLADVQDNPGGGFPGDNTRVLRELLEADAQNAAFACMWDPIVVQLAQAAGVGARLNVRLGGKMGFLSDKPLDLAVEVIHLAEGIDQAFGDARVPLGDTATLRCGGIDIVVNSGRTQTFSPEAFSKSGIDVGAKKLLVLKSTNHFRAGFEPIAKAILYMAPPDVFTFLPYEHIRRPIWPLDADLHG